RFGPTIEPDGAVVVVPDPTPAVTVGLAPVKGQRPEWAIQKLTELGVDAIWLLVAERSVVRWEDDDAARVSRLERVIREAGMQSRRTHLPTLRVGVPVAEAMEAAADVSLADPGGAPPSLARPTVLVGPEGGWS